MQLLGSRSVCEVLKEQGPETLKQENLPRLLKSLPLQKHGIGCCLPLRISQSLTVTLALGGLGEVEEFGVF